MIASLDLADLVAVDGHCHPLWSAPWDATPRAFLNQLSEGRADTMTAHVPHTGYFRRALRDFSRRLGTEASLDAILERRRQLGPEAACRSLSESRVAALLVDTGYPPEAMPLSVMRLALPCVIHEVFRVETCAQALLGKGLTYDDFLRAFRDELHAAARRVVAFKSVIAYRSGLAIRAWPREEVARVYQGAVERVQAGGSARLSEKPLLDTLVEATLGVCCDTGRPLQLHTGFGDPDVDLLESNPLWLRPVLEDSRWASVSFVVLHMAYPYFREAAFMAAVWPQVHVDLSLAMPFLGAGSVPPLIEMLSLAPSTKLLYGSDLGGMPELLALGADWGRAALGEALGWLVERDEVTQDSARGMARQILADNAAALYRLSV